MPGHAPVVVVVVVVGLIEGGSAPTITIIGLSAKNAILIVQFAKSLHVQGASLARAAAQAARLRFRPIVMTSMAFILGVLPLALASGAGAASQ
jgi:multidrug efflux pump